jgi:GTP cyclohydrolase I
VTNEAPLFAEERFNPTEAVREDRLEIAVAEILRVLGYDLSDQHFKKTPERVAKVLQEFAPKTDATEALHLLDAQFDDEHDSLVMVGPIKVTSMCAHHMLPVTGWAWIGYIPEERVCGLSKMVRVAHYWARQYTVQERVTQLIADTMVQGLSPQGVMVVIKQEHGCMTVRGVTEPQAVTVTSAVRGIFKTNEGNCKDEFLRLMQEPSK